VARPSGCTRTADHAAALAIAGEIDESTRAGLVTALRKVTTEQPAVEIDLGGVTYCDLAGIRTILLPGGPGGASPQPSGTQVLRDTPEELTTIMQILGWAASPGLTAEQPAVGHAVIAPSARNGGSHWRTILLP
jgi:ABC-type transporter Mla MlaB component